MLFQNRASDRIVIDDRKAKSFEEREELYVEARNRIFQQHSVSYWSLYCLLSSNRQHSEINDCLEDNREDY